MASKSPHDARLELRLPAETKEAIEADAADRGQKASQLLRWLYDKWVEAGKPQHFPKR